MSLINDVLKDLERRQAASGDELLRGVRAPLGGGGRDRGRAVLLVVALLLLGAGAWYLLRPAPLPVPEAAPLAVPTVLVQGIALTQGAELMTLELSLERAVVHRVERDKDGRRVSLRLNQARLAAPLPRVGEGLLYGLDLARDGDDLVLTLDFPQPPRLRTALEERDGAAALVISAHLEASVVSEAVLRQPVARAEPAPQAQRQPPVAKAEPTPKPPAPAVTQAPAPVPEPAPAAAPEFRKTPARLSPREQADEHFRTALAELQAGRAAAAEAALAQALALEPAHHQARRNLASLLAQQARADEAASLLREGLERWPAQSLLAETLGRLLASQGREAEAVGVLEAGQPAQVGDGEYLALLAALYQRSDRPADAAGLYLRLLRAHPQRGVWWVGLGISLEAAGEGGRARDAFVRAVQTASLEPELKAYAEGRVRALGGG